MNEILHFPKDGKPHFEPNQWQILSWDQDEGGIPDLEHGPVIEL